MDRTPSESSSSKALIVPGKPQLSLNKQDVLEEDEYTEALSAIIARDFFPSLVHLDATNQYLTALESEDPVLINATVRRLTDLAAATPTPRAQNDGRTPYLNFPMDTPLRTPLHRHPSSGQPPTKKPKYDTSLSLDAFQARYTSEDNASFTEILDDENKKRKEKYAWAWNAEDRAAIRKGKELEMRDRMLIEAGASSSFGAGPSRKAITAKGEPERIEEPDMEKKPTPDPNAMEYDSEEEVMHDLEPKEGEDDDDENQMQLVQKPTSEAVVDVMAPLRDKRSTAVSTWKFKVCSINAIIWP